MTSATVAIVAFMRNRVNDQITTLQNECRPNMIKISLENSSLLTTVFDPGLPWFLIDESGNKKLPQHLEYGL